MGTCMLHGSHPFLNCPTCSSGPRIQSSQVGGTCSQHGQYATLYGCPGCIRDSTLALRLEELEREIEEAKKRLRRGWDDHMWNFEHMAEEDEMWLLKWAGHPSGDSDA